MPDFLVSAATGALSPVLGKLGALLGDEYKRFKGVRGEVKFLIQELEAMHAFLLKKSEEENPDAQDKVWMKEVRELSYDIEDSLDDFRSRVDDDSTKPDGFIDKCKNLLAKTKARRRIAKAIQDLKLQVKEVSERHARYKQISNTVMNTSKVTVDPRALAIFEDASRLVGIDQPKKEIISLLKEEDGCISSQHPKIVSIVGIGGIGKTTLAKQVYEELKNKHKFQCCAFFSVSRNPDMSKIFRNILSIVTGQPYYQTEAGSTENLIKNINGLLRTRRYFIVVDDIWDIKTWNTIKLALPNNSCGSVIITTTRIDDVAKACCSLYSHGWVYKPMPLQEQDSERLFHNRIFGIGNECPKNLKEVSGKILKKCGGLPLAIIAISGLLANKAQNGVHSVTQWDQVQTSIGHGLERNYNVEEMMGILSLSYFDLPHHLKSCLLYLSFFPEDYEIEKNHLVRLWVAEGFIPAESTSTLYESGEKAFNELINRNLILPCRANAWTAELAKCRVHDTILDFIVSKSNEGNFVTVHGIPRLTPPPPGTKVRRLSIQGETEEGDATQNYANVRSIISFGSACSLLDFRFLRVLEFSSTLLQNHHLANIGELLQLRYLGLRNLCMDELPEQIGALQYLETLDMRDSDIFQLPTAIVRLKRLVNLLTTRKLRCFPSGIKNMQALEELSSGVRLTAASAWVEDIGDLTKLRHLDVSFISDYGAPDEESYLDLLKKMVSSFQRLNKLETLEVVFISCCEPKYVVIVGDDVILEVSWCSASLRKLVLKMHPMSRVPSWIKSLVNIEILELRIEKLDQESLCILGDLPVLVDLRLQIANNVEDIPLTDRQRLVISNRYGYRSLSCFKVLDDSIGRSASTCIPMLTFEAGSMPKLELLMIDFDADITISVSNGHLDFGLKHPSQLTEIYCFMYGTEHNISRAEVAIKKELANHPKLPHFEYQKDASDEYHYPLTENERSRSLPDEDDYPSTEDERSRSLPDEDDYPSTEDERSRSLLDEDHYPSTEDERSRSLPDEDHYPSTEDEKSRSLPDEDDYPSTEDERSRSLPDEDHYPSTEDKKSLPVEDYYPSTKDEKSNRVRLWPRRRRQSTVDTTQPRPPSVSDLSEQEVIQEPAGDAIVCTSETRSPETTVVLGPRLIAAPQLQGALVPPCFTFSSGSPLNAEVEQQAMDSCKLSQHDDDLANAFTNAFNGLSLGNYQPGSSATAVEAASSNTGTTPATSSVLRPRLIAAPHQQEAFVEPCFTFGSGSPPNAEDLANAFTSTFSGLSLCDDHPGSSATPVEAAFSDIGSSSCKEGGGRQEQAE